ncbi:DUF1345 domain-containing protein [Neopusillimonas aromaticivorans]|uniref:DUF1345 domain-containing protein n=1 Tax=Neopusillimonas aromaticivorans TaxID=2979868 RepID=UPI002593F226|nr:DUF1345 domain-containing protein [Neopusillimonas aromaticivorans]WJJ93496.1 DUF1345 domain-containing protein [Neopusillimonas aromaticivorans]
MTLRKDKVPPGLIVRSWRRIRRRRHFTVSALIFVALALVLVLIGLRPELSLLLAFDSAVVTFLTTTVIMFARSDAQTIRQRVRKEDEDYWGFLLSSAAIAAVVLVALAVELNTIKSANSLHIALAVCSLILAWLFMNTIFALHYAHDYYVNSNREPVGLNFPGTSDPDYWDFLYFAFVIGMTFQVSDVQIDSRAIRRVALAHAMIAFFFNVVVIALSVNIVAGNT